MVLNVCRRVLRREHDAEDAFQATFLTLARKAGAIRKRASLGGWLYQVAYRIALRAAAAPRPRPLPDEPLPDPATPEPVCGLLHREWRSALDEEVGRLPARYRVPFILCHLEGQTTAAAARVLGCPPGTVGTRLARARDLLRRRLARRGLGLPALALTPPAGAAPPAALVEATVRAALLATADHAAAVGLISARVAALTKGALLTMALTKWTVTTALVLAVCLLGGGAVFLARQAPADAAAPAAAAPPAAADDEGPAVVLRPKFTKDRPFYQEVTTTTRQVMKVLGNDVGQSQQQTFYFRWTPTERAPDNGWVLTQRVEGVKLSTDIGGSKITFDSTADGNAPSVLGDFYKSLVGSEFRVTLDQRYRVRQVEGADAFIKKALPVSPDVRTGWAEVVSVDALRRTAEPSFPALPPGPVRRGDSWVRKDDVDLGPLGRYRATHVYTYEGRDGRLDRITLETTLKDRRVRGAESRLPFEVTGGNLERASGTGTILFDREAGRVVRLESELELEGQLDISTGGQKVGVNLHQRQRITVRATPTNPLAATGPESSDRAEIERLRAENERLRRQLKAVQEALRQSDRPND
jgi:RNA polymerase sigma factor (sigma-70 family)